MTAAAAIGFVSETQDRVASHRLGPVQHTSSHGLDMQLIAARHEGNDAGNFPAIDIAGHGGAESRQPRAIECVFSHWLLRTNTNRAKARFCGCSRLNRAEARFCE
jgi:hypothetical protein